MPTTPPTLTSPPSAPSRDDSATFASRGNAFIAWFSTLYTEMVAALANVYANAVDAYNSATLASSSAANAAASANAPIWVSGTTYAIGDVRWSPATYYTYRRLTAGAGTTDPSADPTNWALAGTMLLSLVVSTSTSNTMSRNQHLVLTNAALSTATLPATPTAGDTCWVTPGNGRTDNVIARNGSNIMGAAADYTIVSANVTVALRYIDATLGWRIVAGPQFGSLAISGAAYTSTSSQAFSATPTFNAALSNVFEFSAAMTANVTSLTITNPTAGQTISIRVLQDATGGRTVAAPTGAKILGSVGATASAASILTLTYSAQGARWEGSWTPLPV